jgi:hypothetical protein
MGIKLRIANEVVFPVAGAIKVGGEEQRFDFELVAERLPASELARIFHPDSRAIVPDTVVRVARDWRGVYDGEMPVPFSEGALRSLLEAYPGLAMAALVSYGEAAGVRGREKN